MKNNTMGVSKAGNESLLAPVDIYKDVQINKDAILNNWIGEQLTKYESRPELDPNGQLITFDARAS